MLLAFDIGNTDATIGFFQKNALLYQFRIRSLVHENHVYFEYRLRNFLLENNIKAAIIEKIVLSSVVPSLSPVFERVIANVFEVNPIIVNAHTFAALEISIDNPNEIGSDLIANAVAAYTKYHQNCVIVDFGTALTFTTVSTKGKILGVAIVPGLRTAVKSLFANTAQLPEVPLVLPNSVIGKNTIHAIQAGVLWGYEGLVRGLIHKIRAELNGDCIAIATGGLSAIITVLSDEFLEIDKDLTLHGLRIIGESTQKQAISKF